MNVCHESFESSYKNLKNFVRPDYRAKIYKYAVLPYVSYVRPMHGSPVKIGNEWRKWQRTATSQTWKVVWKLSWKLNRIIYHLPYRRANWQCSVHENNDNLWKCWRNKRKENAVGLHRNLCIGLCVQVYGVVEVLVQDRVRKFTRIGNSECWQYYFKCMRLDSGRNCWMSGKENSILKVVHRVKLEVLAPCSFSYSFFLGGVFWCKPSKPLPIHQSRETHFWEDTDWIMDSLPTRTESL